MLLVILCFLCCFAQGHIFCAKNISECAIFYSLSTSGFKTEASFNQKIYFMRSGGKVFNPNLGGLFRGSFWGGGMGKTIPPPCLKLGRITLETWNLVRKFTYIFGLRRYNFQYQGLLNFAYVSIFFAKNEHVLAKIVPLLK